jgi:hypothetical protein
VAVTVKWPGTSSPEPIRRVAKPGIVLWWLPVGAGGHVVRQTSRWWELLDAHRAHRAPRPLFHAALEVDSEGQRYIIEMGPQWAGPKGQDRGVIVTGPVGLRALGRSPLFRYEVRCWRDGTLPDREWAVGGPVTVADDEATAQTLLQRIRDVPVLTWGRQVPPTQDMWNSNSLVSWLLTVSGVSTSDLAPPDAGRAPGWAAGLAVATDASMRAASGQQFVRWLFRPRSTARHQPATPDSRTGCEQHHDPDH